MNCHPRSKFESRYMVGSDLSRCSELSREFMPSQLKDMMQKRTVLGCVLEVSGHVVAFVIYSKHKYLIEILDFGFEASFVDESAKLVIDLQDRIFNGWKSVKELIYCVPDSELPTHLLLKKLGFKGKMMAGDPPLYRFGWKP